ncbi:MAG: fatty acid desaturase [Thiogranum sp.]
MTNADELDQTALASARQYMGMVAWPTIVLGLVLGVSYVATVAVALTGILSLWFAVPMVAVLTYLSYTVLHESVHGSITGNDQSLRWLNKALGYMAAWIVMIPLTAHRHEHTAHHRYANDEVRDPDFHIGKMDSSPLAPVRAALWSCVSQFSYYAKNRWTNAPSRQNLSLCIEVVAALLPRLAVLAAGYWVEGLALFVLAWLIGAIFLLYLFAYAVHRPHERVGRYVDTSTVLLPGPLQPLLDWFWMYQNYHSIHHLFPRVPFYKYAKLYEEIEGIMVAKGAPIYRISVGGLQQSSPRLAN